MTFTPTGKVEQDVMHEPAELLIKEAREKARRRRVRRMALFTIVVAACLVAIGVIRYAPSPKVNDGPSNSSAQSLTCPSARVKLLGVSEIPGGLGHAGLDVRASVSSFSTCLIGGYPIVREELTNHLTVTASRVQLGYLGGWTASAPPPRLSLTSRSRVVSFTIQSAGCDGPRPTTQAIRITLPGTRETLTARSFYEGGIGLVRGFGIYCGHLFVTPLVKGPTGSGG